MAAEPPHHPSLTYDNITEDGLGDEEFAMRLQAEELMIDHEEFPPDDMPPLEEITNIPANLPLRQMRQMPRDSTFRPTTQAIPTIRPINPVSNILAFATLATLINTLSNESSFLDYIGSSEDYESLLELDEINGVVSKGASPTQIDSLEKYKKKYSSEMLNTQCSVCLSDFTTEDTVLELPMCQHIYHPDCILPWLNINKTCPSCRKEIFPSDPPTPAPTPPLRSFIQHPPRQRTIRGMRLRSDPSTSDN